MVFSAAVRASATLTAAPLLAATDTAAVMTLESIRLMSRASTSRLPAFTSTVLLLTLASTWLVVVFFAQAPAPAPPKDRPVLAETLADAATAVECTVSAPRALTFRPLLLTFEFATRARVLPPMLFSDVVTEMPSATAPPLEAETEAEAEITLESMVEVSLPSTVTRPPEVTVLPPKIWASVAPVMLF